MSSHTWLREGAAPSTPSQRCATRRGDSGSDEVTDLLAFAAAEPELAHERLCSPEHWLRAIGGNAARLGISAGNSQPRVAMADVGETFKVAEQAECRRTISTEGYLCLPALVDRGLCADLAGAVLSLVRRGWPPAFAFVFDEPWIIARQLGQTMRLLVDERLMMTFEMYLWCIDSSLARARPRGFTPHRDAPQSGFDVCAGLSVPRFCTSWLALTDATLDNSCMYVVPASREQCAYRDGDPEIREELGVPLEVEAGTTLVWSGQIAHWGSVQRPNRKQSARVSLACTANRQPHIDVAGIGMSPNVNAPELPQLAQRLELIKRVIRFIDAPEPGSTVAQLLEIL